MRALLLAEFPGALRVERDYDTSLPEIDGDREQLIQAVLNVARNRYKLALAVVIEDDGPGVPPEIAERIFYPLVSGRDGGTGLGLSLAQSFVSQHQGLIEFDSRPGRTHFTLLLPIREKP